MIPTVAQCEGCVHRYENNGLRMGSCVTCFSNGWESRPSQYEAQRITTSTTTGPTAIQVNPSCDPPHLVSVWSKGDPCASEIVEREPPQPDTKYKHTTAEMIDSLYRVLWSTSDLIRHGVLKRDANLSDRNAEKVEAWFGYLNAPANPNKLPETLNCYRFNDGKAARKAWEEETNKNIDFADWMYMEYKGKVEKTKEVIPQAGEQEVYQCACVEYEVDYMDKTLWCHSKKSGKLLCDCGRYVYTQQFCPSFEKGVLKGKWEISEDELQKAKEYKERHHV